MAVMIVTKYTNFESTMLCPRKAQVLTTVIFNGIFISWR